ncbi:unnamed protein product [Darwinula stevensoni]|uniref:Protein kinase domain-containing protein n=1 Tax=Darwinula stevensoni TaxID=69355 RepID=A0A7R9ADL4_9CRUS|nr:unnamed protein product [Darwinula stevensoni]CAG0901431.1 unnamed protein product [Darwinula stevensoni]
MELAITLAMNLGLRRSAYTPTLTCFQIVHRNLAARNILLAEENVVKISGFGFARDTQINNQYIKEGDGPIPYKWMALESLIHENVYTSKSDVWAYGITLWEIFSLGKTPYPGMKSTELIERLQAGYRMEAPDCANEPIYEIMRKCWDADPNDRPTFSVLSEWFATMMPESEHEVHLESIPRILELNKSYEEMNAEHFKKHPDYLQQMASGGFEEGYLHPRGILDFQRESSASYQDNTIHEYCEINENFKSKISDNVPKDEIRGRQNPEIQTDEL